MLDRLIRFCLEQKLIVALLALFIVGWGVIVAPFEWRIPGLERRPLAVDAIPDLGENQQIVFTEWMGRSPQDVQDQVTYPLTVSLLGVPGVRTVRSTSMFGFSSIYIIFEDGIDFYWARTRILEKLNSLAPGLLPEGVQPALGPDATAMGQVFWYTLEGLDPDGQPIGGWDLHELRSNQDWRVRFALQAADGIAEVASVGGFVREYQVDVDPDAMRAHGLTLEQVFEAVRLSNLDVGARTIEINSVEYLVRGLGFIGNVKRQIQALDTALPIRPVIDWDRISTEEVRTFAGDHGFTGFEVGSSRLAEDAWLDWLRATSREDWPAWVTTSQVAIVPFYDRTGLIQETLGTLNKATAGH